MSALRMAGRLSTPAASFRATSTPGPIRALRPQGRLCCACRRSVSAGGATAWQNWSIFDTSGLTPEPMSEIVIHSENYSAALARLASTSKRAAVDVMKQQARLLFVEVAKVTPPAGGKAGNTLQGLKAEKAGKLAIVRDFHMTYGTRSRAYDDIRAAAGEQRAKAFWSQLSNDNLPLASAILKDAVGKSLSPFDGGKAARSMIGKKRKKEVLFYVSDAEQLAAAIQSAQSHVWHLASGWKDAMEALGAKLPYGIGKGSGQGVLRVTVTDDAIDIRMINQVSYARRLPGLQAQINFAMKVRTGELQRSWDAWIRKLAGETGLKAK